MCIGGGPMAGTKLDLGKRSKWHREDRGRTRRPPRGDLTLENRNGSCIVLGEHEDVRLGPEVWECDRRVNVSRQRLLECQSVLIAPGLAAQDSSLGQEGLSEDFGRTTDATREGKSALGRRQRRLRLRCHQTG